MFNPNSPPIHFGIENLTIETMPPPAGNPFANNFLGVQTFLDLHSRNNFSQYCLSYRFTHRDFDDGVVGLAYIGPQPSSNAAGKTCVCVCVCMSVSVIMCCVICEKEKSFTLILYVLVSPVRWNL